MNRCPHCSQNHAPTNHFCPVTGLPIPLGARLVSTRLLDKYLVVQILGEGPVGIVLEVEDTISKKRYAAKVIHPRFTRDQNIVQSFMNDVTRVQSVACDHIAGIIQVGRDAGAAIVVIRELMTGECLADRLKQVGRFSLPAAVTITREILTALNAIHQSSVINLDLSPADIFLIAGPNGSQVKMLDIGERHIKAAMPSDASRPESYNYFAPEQLDKSRQPNLRSDFYAAGAILYQMLTGTAPAGVPAPVESIREDVPPDLARITAKALESTPNHRYQSAAEFVHDLDSINWNPGASSLRDSSNVVTSTAPQSALSAAEENLGAADASAPAASVIVEMEEIAPPSSKKRIIAIVAILLLLAGGAAAFLALRSGGDSDAVQAPAIVEITVETVPADAVVHADGKRVTGRPAVVRVTADTSLHTIAVKAEGYESLERDVRFDVSKVVKFELMEIIQPDEPMDGNALPAAAPDTVPEPAAAPSVEDESSVSAAGAGSALPEPPPPSKKSSGRVSGKTKDKASGEKPKKSKKASAKPVKSAPTPSKEEKAGKNVDGFRTTNPFE